MLRTSKTKIHIQQNLKPKARAHYQSKHKTFKINKVAPYSM